MDTSITCVPSSNKFTCSNCSSSRRECPSFLRWCSGLWMEIWMGSRLQVRSARVAEGGDSLCLLLPRSCLIITIICPPVFHHLRPSATITFLLSDRHPCCSSIVLPARLRRFSQTSLNPHATAWNRNHLPLRTRRRPESSSRILQAGRSKHLQRNQLSLVSDRMLPATPIRLLHSFSRPSRRLSSCPCPSSCRSPCRSLFPSSSFNRKRWTRLSNWLSSWNGRAEWGRTAILKFRISRLRLTDDSWVTMLVGTTWDWIQVIRCSMSTGADSFGNEWTDRLVTCGDEWSAKRGSHALKLINWDVLIIVDSCGLLSNLILWIHHLSCWQRLIFLRLLRIPVPASLMRLDSGGVKKEDDDKEETRKRMAKKERERKRLLSLTMLATRVNDRTERSVGWPEWEDQEWRRRRRREEGEWIKETKREAKWSFCSQSVLLLIHRQNWPKVHPPTTAVLFRQTQTRDHRSRRERKERERQEKTHSKKMITVFECKWSLTGVSFRTCMKMGGFSLLTRRPSLMSSDSRSGRLLPFGEWLATWQLPCLCSRLPISLLALSFLFIHFWALHTVISYPKNQRKLASCPFKWTCLPVKIDQKVCINLAF